MNGFYKKIKDLPYRLSEMRKMLLAHPKVLQDQLRLRFLGFGAYSLEIQIFVHIKSKDYEDYLAIREDINFHIMDIADECGTSFAFPSTTNYFARDDEPDQEKRENAEEQTREMVRDTSLSFPNYSKEDIKNIKATLQYPPE